MALMQAKEAVKNLFSRPSRFTDEQRYTLDAMGNVIARNVIPLETIEKINGILDKTHKDPQVAPDDRIDPISSKFAFLHLDPVFMELMEHRWIMDACRSILGHAFRFDHAFGKFQDRNTSIDLYGGPYTGQGSSYFANGLSERGTVLAGHIKFCIPLVVQTAQTGGFCYIPGSHRSSYKMAGTDVLRKIIYNNWEAECLHYPSLNPGDIMLQPEATVHGTAPWRGHHDRKFLYYAYSPSFMAWTPYHQIEHLMTLAKTDLQKKLLRPPYVANMVAGGHQERRTPTES